MQFGEFLQEIETYVLVQRKFLGTLPTITSNKVYKRRRDLLIKDHLTSSVHTLIHSVYLYKTENIRGIFTDLYQQCNTIVGHGFFKQLVVILINTIIQPTLGNFNIIN